MKGIIIIIAAIIAVILLIIVISPKDVTPKLNESFRSTDRISDLPADAEILFVSNRDTGSRRAEIYSMDAEGGNQKRLTFTSEHHFIMGIDHSRRYIVTSRSEIDTNKPEGIGDEDRRALWLIDLQTKRETRLTDIENHAESRSFSPDGEWIVFGMRTPGENLHDIYKIKKDGTELTRLTNNPKYMEIDVAWSNKGDRIAFDFVDFQEDDPHSVIKIMDSNGGNIKSLHEERAGVSIPNAFVAGDYDASWSLDDEWIAFERPVAVNKDDPENFGSGIWHIFKIKSDGSGEIIDLSEKGGHTDRAEYLPSFSPDGKSIVFGSIHKTDPIEESFSDIFKMDSETGEAKRLTTSPGVDMFPVWIK